MLSLDSGPYDDGKACLIFLVCVTSYAAYVKSATVMQANMHWSAVAKCIDASVGVCVSSVNPPFLGRFLLPSRHMLSANVQYGLCCLAYRLNSVISDKKLVGAEQSAAKNSMQPSKSFEQDFVVPASDVKETLPYIADVLFSEVREERSALIQWKVFRREGSDFNLMHTGSQWVSDLFPSRSISVPIFGATTSDILRVQFLLRYDHLAPSPVDIALLKISRNAFSNELVDGLPIEDSSFDISVRYK